MVQYELMRPAEIMRARSHLPLAFIPIGPIEWHGPHLPMGMDGLHAHAVAVEVARRVGGVVLPTYYIGSETLRPADGGPQSSAVLGFEGTERIIGMDFPQNPVKSLYFEEGTFAVTVRELIRLLRQDGYRLIVIVNGHGAPNHQRTLQRLAAEGSDPPRACVAFAMAFLPAEPPFSDPGHAEKVETSIILATRPDLVDLSTLPAKSVPLRYQEFGIVDGKAFDGSPTPHFTVRPEADPREASAEFGRKILDAEVERVAAMVRDQVQTLGLAGSVRTPSVP